MEQIRRKLSKDIDISTMLNMREQGMTNKQIADSLGVHPNTVYRYIGRMSQAVKYAEITNKPSPIVQQIAVPASAAEPVKAETNKRNRQLEKIARQTAHTIEEMMPAEKHEPVENAEAQIPAEAELFDGKTDSEEAKENLMEKKATTSAPSLAAIERGSLLRVISTRSTLQGSMCNYIVDSESGSIEMTDGLISGLLDRDTVHRFIAELQEACKLLG